MSKSSENKNPERGTQNAKPETPKSPDCFKTIKAFWFIK